MRHANAIFPSFLIVGSLLLGETGYAQQSTTTTALQPTVPPATQGEELTGLWLTTPFPAIEKPVGEDIELAIDIENRNLPPQRVSLAVDGLPDGWKWELRGEGHAIMAAMVEPDQSVGLTLAITPPEDAKTGSYELIVSGDAASGRLTLPITLTLAAAEQARVTVEPKLPALRGTPRSTFDFQIKATNDSSKDQVFNLVAEAPPGFQAVFKEQYGTQELTSIPIKAGASADVKLSVTPPPNVAAGQYGVAAAVMSQEAGAKVDLLLDITGQPTIALTGPEGRLSGDATAGRERTFNFTVSNTGTAPARNVKMSASSPSEWKVAFSPEAIEVIEPGEEVEVAVSMTPSEKAIAGDYIVTVRANGDGTSESATFRVTVLTSTMWGIAGLGVIGAAVIVLAVAVTRYGRR
jgi:uncharacterized membrane protein